MSKHRSFRLDATDTPPHYAKAGNHTGVRIGSDQCVGKAHAVFEQNSPGEVLQIDLMEDSGAGRKKPYAVIGLHGPFDEAEALGVAADLQLHVSRQRVGRTVKVDGQCMVENHINRHFGPDAARRIAKPLNRAADCRQIAQQRNSGRAIKNDAPNRERNFGIASRPCLPAREIANLAFVRPLAIAIPYKRFQHHPQRYGQPGYFSETELLKHGKREKAIFSSKPEIDFALKYVF